MVRERFLVKSYGDNVDGVRAGLTKMLQLLGTYGSAVIVVPNIGQVKDTMLTDVLGPELSKKIIKDREISFGDGKKVILCGQLTLKNYRKYDVYLDLWGTKFSVKEIEALHNCQAIVLVTWMPDDSVEWAQEYPVVTIYDDKQTGTSAGF
jgi:hypothetical protein